VTRYRTIVADPPWPYPEGHIRTAATGHSHNRTRDGAKAVQGADVRRELPYQQLSVQEISDLPVRDLAHQSCRLFLWTTNRYLPDAFGVLAAWGFDYRQMLVWHKAGASPFPLSVAIGSAEFLLVGQRGKPSRGECWPDAVVKIGVPKDHSRKPEAFLDLVEQVSPGPYLELFARRQRLGWDTWGNEALDHTNGALAGNGEARTAPAVPETPHGAAQHERQAAEALAALEALRSNEDA
jgi:N6-adenosine-specific RNA methylase IME4